MKITEVAADGLAVSALIAAAGAVNDLLADRNVELAVAEGVLVVVPRGQGFGPGLVAAVEKNPRLIRIEPEPEPEHTARHFYVSDDGRKHCLCTNPCCNDLGADVCTCRECESKGHNHER